MGVVLCCLSRKCGMEELATLKVRNRVQNGLKLSGDVITVGSLVQPFIIFWGTGTLEGALKLYNEVQIGCTALSSYGWLLYSVIQVSYKEGGPIIGIDAIVVNSITWTATGFMFVVLLLCFKDGKGSICIGVIVVHIGLAITILQFPIFKWVTKDGPAKLTIGIIAGICQCSSEIIPLINLRKMWLTPAPDGGHPRVKHYKKFVIIGRAIDSIITVYWMVYCVFTYQFDVFGISNIICAALSVLSFILHSAWAVQP